VSAQEALPGLLFPSEPPQVEDAYGNGLPEAFVEQVKGLLSQDYIIFDVVEAQRLLQVRSRDTLEMESSHCSQLRSSVLNMLLTR
jgi:hypothetical protein